MFDRNGDRRISARELAAVIRQALGGEASILSEDEIAKLVLEADTNQENASSENGTLDFEDFLQMM